LTIGVGSPSARRRRLPRETRRNEEDEFEDLEDLEDLSLMLARVGAAELLAS